VFRSPPISTIRKCFLLGRQYFVNNTGHAQLYQGRIEAYDPDEQLYLIRYDDDDAEDMIESEVTELLVTESILHHDQELEHSKQPPNATTCSDVSGCTAPSGQVDYPIGTSVQKVC
jgi:hypothetical protein